MKFSSKTYLFAIGIFLVVITLVIWLVIINNSSVTKIDYAVTPQPQSAQKRLWRDIEFQYENHSNSKLLSRPLYIKKGPRNDLYVSDYGYNKVKEFNIEGKFQESFGEGGGKGPGEMINIVSFAFAPSGDLWVADGPTSKITIFKADTFQTINTHEVPERAIPLGNDHYLFQSRFNSQPVLKKLNTITEKKFRSLVKKPDIWSYGLGAFFLNDGVGGVIRVNIYFNSIARYDTSGTILYFRQPVSPPEPPEFNPPKRNRLHVKFNTVKYSTLSESSEDFSLMDNQIHVLIKKKEAGGVQEFVDVYSLQKGDYMYSYHLPDTLRSIAVTSHHLAGIPIDSTYVMIWKNKTGW